MRKNNIAEMAQKCKDCSIENNKLCVSHCRDCAYLEDTTDSSGRRRCDYKGRWVSPGDIACAYFK